MFFDNQGKITFRVNRPIWSEIKLFRDFMAVLLICKTSTNFPQSQPLVKDCQFGVSSVNYSDSEDDPIKSKVAIVRTTFLPF